MTQSRGMTIRDAMKYVATPAEWQEFERRELDLHHIFVMGGGQTEGDRRAVEAERLRSKIEAKLLEQLTSGRLIAFGFEKPIRAGGERQRITPVMWEFLRPDHSVDSEAGGHGLSLVEIRIFQADEAPKGTAQAERVRVVRRAKELIEASTGEHTGRTTKAACMEHVKRQLQAEGLPVTGKMLNEAWQRANVPDVMRRAGRPKNS